MADDIRDLRSSVLSTRYQFSPHLQSVKGEALDKIIEQILSRSDSGMTRRDINSHFSYTSGGYKLSNRDLGSSLARLMNSKRASQKYKYGMKHYYISEEAKQEIETTLSKSEKELKDCVERVLKDTTEDFESYIDPFFTSLTLIFAEFGEECTNLFLGKNPGSSLFTPQLISDSVDIALSTTTDLDRSILESSLIRFFDYDDIHYNEIKWHLAQNYFITKALGLDPSGAILSRKAFYGSTFYLDTNIIIEALAPFHDYHQSILAFFKGCDLLKIHLKICDISLSELDRWLGTSKGTFLNTYEDIPIDTEKKIDDIFFRAYLYRKNNDEDFEIDELFSAFIDPATHLEEITPFEIVADSWLHTAIDDSKTKSFSEKIRVEAKKRYRKKTRMSALHDAILINWVLKERESRSNTWIVTTDSLLPYYSSIKNKKPIAITIDSLIQWMTPFVTADVDMQDYATVFSHMIKSRLLPQERIFHLEDFRLFHEVNLSCKSLPAQDIEDCIKYYKANIPLLDPSRPEDRETIQYHLAKFFSSPEREYQRDLKALEDMIYNLEGAVGTIQTKLDTSKSETSKELKRRTFYQSLLIIVLISSALYVILTVLTHNLGDGTNLFQKIINAWPFYTGLTALILGMWRFILKRIRS
jgi:predicted nucleic acid-binding protein